MTTRKRIANYGEMLIVSFFCTLIVYFGQNVLVGVGGRLGSFAGIAVLSLLVLKSPMKGKEKYDQTNSNSETKTKRDVG